MIADNTGRYKIVYNFEDIASFLCHNNFRNKFNWFFNIAFDFDSIVKHLSKNELLHLYETGKLNVYEYRIAYLKGKYFSITDKNNHTHTFYDINNFLESSLNKASKAYLNDSKMDIIDRERLNTDLRYWKYKEKEIIEYCIYDAVLTKKLADYFWQLMYDTIHFYPNKPFSKGKYSEEYFLKTCYMPTINAIKKEVLRYAYNSYSGGRFELLQKGFFDAVYIYDLKSAYPFQMTNLIDYNLGEFIYTKEFCDDAYSGFYLCDVSFFNSYFSPFMQKINDVNVYCNGLFQTYLTQNEIQTILKLFPDTEIEILNGYAFYPNAITTPLKEEIERLYAWKEREKDDKIKYAVKIIMNSLYGKFIQTVGGNTGKLFNPMWASEITANTRLSLMEFAIKNPEKIISFSTDSIHTIEPLNIKYKRDDKFGEFSLDFEGKGTYIMSDVYHVEGEYKRKEKARGFIYDTESKKTLLDILQSIGLKQKYQFTIKKPTHLGEALRHRRKKRVDDINIFQVKVKTIDINRDTKRLWERDFKNAYDAMENNIQSMPIMVKNS